MASIVTSVQRVGFATGATPTFLNATDAELGRIRILKAPRHACLVFPESIKTESLRRSVTTALPDGQSTSKRRHPVLYVILTKQLGL
jgi:hypothetical protein